MGLSPRETREAIDAMLSAIRVVKMFGASFNGSYMYQDDSFVISSSDKYLHVTRSNNEDAGEPLLLVWLEDGQTNVIKWKPGPWVQRMEETYKLCRT